MNRDVREALATHRALAIVAWLLGPALSAAVVLSRPADDASRVVGAVICAGAALTLCAALFLIARSLRRRVSFQVLCWYWLGYAAVLPSFETQNIQLAMHATAFLLFMPLAIVAAVFVDALLDWKLARAASAKSAATP